MAIVRRRSARSGRRTNWIGNTTGFHGEVAPGATDSWTLVDVSSSSEESSNYVDATLVRLRGIVLVDWDIDADAAQNNGQAIVMCHVSEVDPTTASISGALTRESLIWHDMCGVSHDTGKTEGAGTDPNVDLAYQYTWEHQRLVVDVKAKRRLGDTNKIIFSIWNRSISQAKNLNWSVVARALLME